VLVIDNIDMCLCDVILGSGIHVAISPKLLLSGTIYGGCGLTNFISLRSLLQNVGAIH
jgi:hypothetical protein